MSRHSTVRGFIAALVFVPVALIARDVDFGPVLRDVAPSRATSRSQLTPLLLDGAVPVDAPVAGGARSGGTVVVSIDARERVLYALTITGARSKLAGARRITWDGVPEQYDPRGENASVEKMRQLASEENVEPGTYILDVSSTSGGRSVAWALEAGRGQLLAYQVGAGGVKLAGGRRIVHDLAPQELVSKARRLSVSVVRQQVGEKKGPRAVAVLLSAGTTTAGAPLAFVLDREHGRLAAYTVDTTGIRYLGTRALGWDLLARELDSPTGSLSVAEMKSRTKNAAPARFEAARIDVASSFQGGSICAVVEPERGRLGIYVFDGAGIALRSVRSFERDSKDAASTTTNDAKASMNP